MIKRLLKNAIVVKRVTHPITPRNEVENTRTSQKEYKWFKEIRAKKVQKNIIIMGSILLFAFLEERVLKYAISSAKIY